ncbi:ribosome biogenesis GTPase A [Caloramator fervidus]|uniref:Ribosome biogenesis GTPase A n=1 Tax=Caloramator fervidus TaxID=29344 RepID=A0A1H5XBA6_9CLOT|nr:ribosome biogenesis GTPase YlqF [Caloramator fervidus]SEG09044.1 ribosome biogenesis GTPase A [Caloramator fervidus]
MNIQWYPGHMVKTKKQISESIKLIDVVLELLDARVPISSKNPDVDTLIQNKPKIILLNKSDLADPNITKEWIEYYKNKGIIAIDIDCISGKNMNKIYPLIKELLSDKIERIQKRGIVGRPIRALVLGIPNVGKSTFINKISKKSSAQTGDRPGVTKNKQWIKVNKEFELLDTPGILWPKFQDKKVALHLAYVKAIKEEILDIVELCVKFLEEMLHTNPKILQERYKVDIKNDAYLLMEDIGRKRGCIVSGGDVDLYRTANIIFEDFRNAKLGRISLERPLDMDGDETDVEVKTN